MKRSTCFNLLFFFSSVIFYAQNGPESLLPEYAGLYQDAQGQKYLLNPVSGFPHFVVLASGETHMLRHRQGSVFEYSGTRNNWDAMGGTLTLKQDQGERKLCITERQGSINCAAAVPIRNEDWLIDIDEKRTLAGSLLQPQQGKSNLVAILLHGDGDNDRYDLFDLAMYLVDAGYSVVNFDKRNVGLSGGPVVEGDNYDEISREYAWDAVLLTRKLMQRWPDRQFGVIGISQGGWIGSIVSAEVPELKFYVNIAGNISTGWQQWRHYMLSYLKRNGFTPHDVAEAEDYFQRFFDLGLQKISFESYQLGLDQYRDRPWFKKLATRKLLEWKDPAMAVRVLNNNLNEPAVDVSKVNAPTLGIFYAFDHSTPPNSPDRFLHSLRSSNAPDVCVRVFPNTTHGGWVVPSYYFNSARITRQESRAYYFITDWLKTL